MIWVLFRFLFKPWSQILNHEFLTELRLRKISNASHQHDSGSVNINGERYFYHHAASFCNQFREIFFKQIYLFQTTNPSPVIIDGGANMGLAVRFWKKHFPMAQITAIEPDEEIFRVLTKNTDFCSDNVELIRAMLWSEAGEADFSPDGMQGGRGGSGNISVKCILLSDLLRQKDEVDLLKLDIEGAEFDVLEEASEYLRKCKNIFIEYHSFEKGLESLNQILALLVSKGFSFIVSGESWNKPFLETFPDRGMRYTLNIFATRI